MREFLGTLRAPIPGTNALVRAAMAHLNLVMVHPFRDGNGRMARCLQTLVLAREGILAPEFSSVEEFLGRNTDEYYKVLGDVGAGKHPERDASPWIRYSPPPTITSTNVPQARPGAEFAGDLKLSSNDVD
jgi:Fic family protein